MKSPNTNWHVIVAGIAVTIVSVTMLLMKMPVEAVGTVAALILGVLAQSGLLQAADAQKVATIENMIAPQIASAVQVAKDDLIKLHAVSTANVAAVEKVVAVHAALLKAPEPQPLLSSPAETPTAPVAPHLV